MEGTEVEERPRLLGKIVHARFVPLLLLAAFASSPLRTVVSQYVFQRFAEDRGLDPKNATTFQNRTDCLLGYNQTRRNATSLEDQVQQDSATFTMYMSLALNIPSMFSMPVWGALSDKVGRKIPIVAGITGSLIRIFADVLVIYLDLPLWGILIGEAVHGVFGYHTHTILYIASAYIVDNGQSEMRAFEMVLVDMWLVIGSVLGSLITGYMLKDIGYLPPLVLVMCIEVLLIGYTLYIIPVFGSRREAWDTYEMAFTPKHGILHNVKDMMTRTFKVLFMSDIHHRELLMLVAIFFITGFASSGGSDFINTYAMGWPLCWRSVLLSVFQSVDMLLKGIAATVVTLLWKTRGWRLELMMLMGIASCVLEYAIFGFARSTALMFVGVVVGGFYMLIHASGRTLGSRLISHRDQGALMSGLTNAEMMAKLFGTIAFKYIYTSTLDVYEGIVFFAASISYLPCFLLLWKLFKLGAGKIEGTAPLILNEPVTEEL